MAAELLIHSQPTASSNLNNQILMKYTTQRMTHQKTHTIPANNTASLTCIHHAQTTRNQQPPRSYDDTHDVLC